MRVARKIIIVVKPNLERSFTVALYCCENICSLSHSAFWAQTTLCIFFFFFPGTVNLIQEWSNYEEVNPVLWMISVDYPGRSPSRWLVQSEFTLGLGLWTDSFFHSIKCNNCQKDSIVLDANHYCRQASVDKVEAWALSPPRTCEGVSRHHISVKEKQNPVMVMHRRKRGPEFKMQVFISFSRSVTRFRASILVSCLSVIHEVSPAVCFCSGPHGSWGDWIVRKVNLLPFYLGYLMTLLCMACLPWVALKTSEGQGPKRRETFPA